MTIRFHIELKSNIIIQVQNPILFYHLHCNLIATTSLNFIIKVTYPRLVQALLGVLREDTFRSDSESRDKTRSWATDMKSVSFSVEQKFNQFYKIIPLNRSVVELEWRLNSIRKDISILYSLSHKSWYNNFLQLVKHGMYSIFHSFYKM